MPLAGRSIAIIGVPMDLGAARRGVDMGPSAIRYARLEERLRALGHEVVDLGNLRVPDVGSQPQPGSETRLKHLAPVVRTNRALARVVARTLAEGQTPLVLGGDHSIAIGTLAGVAKVLKNPGVLWFDTHGDFNTDATTPSGNIHGMPLAASVGRGHPALLKAREGAPAIREENVVLIGVRELDPEERAMLKESAVHVVTMADIDRLGMGRVLAEAVERLSACDGVHVSFDMDVMDPMLAPGVGTPHRGGLTYREAHLAMERLYEAGILRSFELVEVNPILDRQNETAELAAELIASAFGQQIL
jgi:arginase